MASLTVLLRTLGKRSTAIYLGMISLCAVLSGLAVDRLYAWLGITARASVAHTTEALPHWAMVAGAVALLLLSIAPLWKRLKGAFSKPSTRQADPIAQPRDEAGTDLTCLPGSNCGPS
jgi:hypothetical protein